MYSFFIKWALTHLIGRDLLEVYNVHTAFSPKGEMILDLEDIAADWNINAEKTGYENKNSNKSRVK